MKAVILAAGKGVRLRPLTDKVPKAMVGLNGKPLLEWNLERLKGVGIDEAGIIIGYKGEVIEKHFGKEWKGIKITYVRQEEQKGTADATKLAKEFSGGERFLMLCCDVIAPESSLRGLMGFDEFGEYDVVILARKVKDPWRYGVLLTKEHIVTGIIEKPAFGEAPSNLVNAGIYLLSGRIFEDIEKTPKSLRGEYELTETIKMLIPEGKVAVVIEKKEIIDIADLDDLKRAEGRIEKQG